MIRKAKYLFILFLIFSIFIIPANAIQFTVTGITCVGPINPVSSYTGDRDTIFYVGIGNNLTVYDMYGSNSNIGDIRNLPSSIDDVYGTEDYIFVILDDGQAYRFDNFIGLKDFDAMSSEDGDFVLLGDFSTGTNQKTICVDANSDIFIGARDPDKVWKIDHLSLTSATFLSSGVSYPNVVTNGLNGLIVLGESGGVYNVDSLENATQIGTSLSAGSINTGVQQLTNGNIILAGHGYNSNAKALKEVYLNGTIAQSIYDGAEGNEWSGGSATRNDFLVLSNGIIVNSQEANDLIITYTTLDNVGGYSPLSGSSSTSLTNLYQNQLIESLYSTYYNNQNIQTHYLVATSILNESAQDYYKNTYGIQVELEDESGSFVNSYFVDGSEFEAYDFTNPLHNWFTNLLLSYVLDEYLMINGYQDFSNNENWLSGNYTLKMYEVNKYSGSKALLGSDTFQIYNSTSPYTNTTTETNNDYSSSGGSGDFNDMLENIISLMTTKAFWGVIIWSGLVVGVAQRRDSNGDHIDTKQIGIFGIIAAILLAIAGAFEPYTWFVVVICIILAAVAFVNFGKGFSGLGGGN